MEDTKKERKKGSGGARTGAGRKDLKTKSQRTVTLSDKMWAYIDSLGGSYSLRVEELLSNARMRLLSKQMDESK